MAGATSGGYNTYRSYALVMIAMLSAVMLAALAMVSDVVKTNQKDQDLPGQMSVFVAWDDGDNDVDLWVKSPDDDYGVGYSRTHGVSFDLLRDDLGSTSDTDKNFENAYNRTLPAGEYVVNIHCFDCTSKLPVNVMVQVLLQHGFGSTPQEIIKTTVQLYKLKQERTVIRFTLTEDGFVLRDKTTTLCKPLKEAKCS